MIFLATKKNKVFTIEKDFTDHTKKLKNGYYQIEIKKSKRTDTQNNSLHLYFEWLAQELNDAGYELKQTLRKDFDIPWTAELVKELLWRPLQKVILKKHSTTKLNKIEDIDKVYRVLDREIGQRTGVSVPFPSKESAEQFKKSK